MDMGECVLEVGGMRSCVMCSPSEGREIHEYVST